MIKPLDLEWKEIESDMVIKGKVTRLEKFGAFVDIGAERPGLVHISEMTHDYIKTPSEVVKEGDEIDVKVLSVDRQKNKSTKHESSGRTTCEGCKEVQQQPVVQKASSNEPEVKEAPVPTAMEMALREAMERKELKAEETGQVTKGKKKSAPRTIWTRS